MRRWRAPRRSSGRPRSCSTSIPATPRRSSSAVRSGCGCTRCSRTSACRASPRPRARRGCSCMCRSTRRAVDYEQTKRFAKAVAELLEREEPDLVVSRMTKARRTGKVLIDWSQNDRRKTTVCVYSLRAGDRPTVSTPVDWEEVRDGLGRRRPRHAVVPVGRGARASGRARGSVRTGALPDAGASPALIHRGRSRPPEGRLSRSPPRRPAAPSAGRRASPRRRRRAHSCA